MSGIVQPLSGDTYRPVTFLPQTIHAVNRIVVPIRKTRILLRQLDYLLP